MKTRSDDSVYAGQAPRKLRPFDYYSLPGTAGVVAAALRSMQRGRPSPDVYGPLQPAELRRANFGIADGALVGVNGGAAHVAQQALCSPVRPSTQAAAEQVVFINGIGTTPIAFMAHLRSLAESGRGCLVHGIYNASRGLGRDVVRGYRDHLRAQRNPALVQLARLIERALIRGFPLHIVAHSQGAAVTAEALRLARNSVAGRFSKTMVDRHLRLLRIETHGAAGCRFIDGPRYVHYIHTRDPVPHAHGLAPGLSLSRLHYPGRGAVFRYFTHVEPNRQRRLSVDEWHKLVHRMTVYAGYRVSFAEARAAGSTPVDRGELLARLRWAPIRLFVDLTSLPITCVSAVRQAWRWLTAPTHAAPGRVRAATLSAGR